MRAAAASASRLLCTGVASIWILAATGPARPLLRLPLSGSALGACRVLDAWLRREPESIIPPFPSAFASTALSSAPLSLSPASSLSSLVSVFLALAPVGFAALLRRELLVWLSHHVAIIRGLAVAEPWGWLKNALRCGPKHVSIAC